MKRQAFLCAAAAGLLAALAYTDGSVPGRVVGSEEAAALRGGDCLKLKFKQCGATACTASQCYNTDDAGDSAQKGADDCNAGCRAYKVNSCTGGS